MNAFKAPEQQQQPQRQQQQQVQQHQQQAASGNQAGRLNDRYGKIGISAVAGAVAHKPEQKLVATRRFTTLDSD